MIPDPQPLAETAAFHQHQGPHSLVLVPLRVCPQCGMTFCARCWPPRLRHSPAHHPCAAAAPRPAIHTA